MPFNILKRRKAQLKTLETVAAVVFFSLLLMLGIIFFSKFQAGENEDRRENIVELSANDLAKIVSEMPEIRCEKESCIDVYKVYEVAALAKKKNNNLFYSSAFGSYSSSAIPATIILRLVYPDNKDILLYNRTKKDGVASRLFEFPVSAYNATSGRYSFAMLSIRVYQ
jgi:hypothetical protein